jgi:hypothetical protein
MMRSFWRVEDLASDHADPAKFGYEAEDAARDFFTDCFHLKDYLKKLPGMDGKAVEDFVRGSRPLSIAGDVANSLKHGGLDHGTPRAGAPIVAINTATRVSVPKGGDAQAVLSFAGRNPRDGDSVQLGTHVGTRGFGSVTVTITVGTETFYAYDLARKCIADWKGFLASHGLVFRLEE